MKDDQIRRAFDEVCAEDSLKENTLAFLQTKARARRVPPLRRALVLAACAVILFAGGLATGSAYFSAAAYVDIDVNPGMALTLNRFGRVIGTDAYNDEGADILERVALRHRTCAQALQVITEEMTAQGYLKERGLFTATLQSGGSAQPESIEALQAEVAAALEEYPAVAPEVFEVDAETRQAAQEHHVSPAKYLAIQELMEVDPEASFEGCQDHSVGQIRARTRAHGHGGGTSEEELPEDGTELPAGETTTSAQNSRSGTQGHGHHGGRH